MAGTTSSVARTPRKTPFKKIPWWSAFQNGPLQTSGRPSGPQSSDATGLVTEAESDFETDSNVVVATMQHPVALLDEDSDVASEVRSVVRSVAPSATRPKTEGITAGRSAFDLASQPSTCNTGSFEIPETPSAAEERRCPVHPSVVRVVDKRLDAKRPQYLVLCWMYPQEGGASDSELDRHFQGYDKKVSQDLARQERLSTLRARKKHMPTDGHQNPDQSRKKARIQTAASAFTSQNHTYHSRQVDEDLFLDVGVRSVDLNLI